MNWSLRIIKKDLPTVLGSLQVLHQGLTKKYNSYSGSVTFFFVWKIRYTKIKLGSKSESANPQKH